MKNSLLTELLLMLSSNERDEFRLFVQSPYFNRGKGVTEMLVLLDALTNLIVREAPDAEWEKNSVFQKAYPRQIWTAKKMDNRMSILLQLLRRFLAELSLTKAPESPEFRLALAEQYLRRSLPRRFELIIKEIEVQLEASPYRDHRYFELKMKKAILRHEHEMLYRRRFMDVHLKHALENLWLYYHLMRLKWQGALLFNKKVPSRRETPDAGRMENSKLLPDDVTQRFPILYLWEAMGEVRKRDVPTPTEIQHFQAFLSTHKDEIPLEDRKYFSTMLRNLCVERNNEMDTEILKLAHQLHIEQLKEGYLFYLPGKLTSFAFLNITLVALICREDAWAEQFIEQYRDHIIGETDSRDYYRLVLAKLLAFRKKWEEALDILPGPFLSIAESLIRSRLEIILLYETRSPLLHARLEAFKVQLSRFGAKTLTLIRKKRQVEFVNFVYQLLRAKPGDTQRALKIKNRILAIPNLPDKAWLLEAVDTLAGFNSDKQ